MVATEKPMRLLGGLHESIYFRATTPIFSMYGIFTYIWVIFRVHVGKDSIHGAFGTGKSTSYVLLSNTIPLSYDLILYLRDPL